MKKKLNLLTALLIGFALALIFSQPVSANWLLDSQGQLQYLIQGLVLGKSDKGNQSPGNSAAAPGQSASKTTPANPQSVNAKSNRVLLQTHGNKIQPTFVDEAGQALEDGIEATESPEFEIEEPEGTNNITVRAHENAAMVIRNKIAAQTHFPIMVNLETNELIITTPKGQKVVTVLPDKAVEHMLAANVLDQLGGKGGIRWLEYQASQATPSATPEATESGETTPSAATAEIFVAETTPVVAAETPILTLTTDQEGTLVYEIEGTKFEKLLGLFKVKLDRIVVVSAETGELVTIKENLLTRLLDFLSI
jgi:hypothetical protein